MKEVKNKIREITALSLACLLTVLPACPAEAAGRPEQPEMSQDLTDETVEEADGSEDAEENGVFPAAEEEVRKERELFCTILGDSIAKGYSGDKSVWIECYGRVATKEIASEKGCAYRVSNYAKTGLASEGLNEKVLSKEQVLKDVERSNLILVTMGSNDLLNECKNVVRNILDTDAKFKSADEALSVLGESVKKNPLLVLKIINALSNWDYLSFEAQWIEMMETLEELKGEDTVVIVTNIYNPVANRELPSTMNRVVEDIIGNMNSIISKHSVRYGYKVADLSKSSVTAHVQKDGVHPDQDGQRVIAGIVKKEYDVTVQNGGKMSIKNGR